MICYQQKNVVKPGYSVFIHQTTSAGVVWLLTALSHSLHIDMCENASKHSSLNKQFFRAIVKIISIPNEE